MNLRNTTAHQDDVLAAEFRELRRLDFDPSVIESILEDLDNRLGSEIGNAQDAADAAEMERKELQTRISELEDAFSNLETEHAELMLQHEKLQRHAGQLEAELKEKS